jgi:cell division protein FtsL
MKTLVLILSVVIMYANTFNIDKEITELKKLPPDKRYKLMNKIKLQIMKLNEKERIKILKKFFNAPIIPEENSIKENQSNKGKK